MLFSTKALSASLLLMMVTTLSAGSLAFYYRGNVISLQEQVDNITVKLQLANATISDLQVRQRDVATLDAKYTKDLADAQATIKRLRHDVDNGRRRLQLNASRPSLPADKAAGVDDAGAAELTSDARQNYFYLREQLVTSEKQILGLQEYIRKLCLGD